MFSLERSVLMVENTIIMYFWAHLKSFLSCHAQLYGTLLIGFIHLRYSPESNDIKES